jgi:hypothetical protein
LNFRENSAIPAVHARPPYRPSDPTVSLVAKLSCFLAFALLAASGCRSPETAAIQPVYDKLTGKLQLLKYDANGDGRIDTWSYMDGTRVLRIEIDKDEDGKIERWEYYDANQKLEKTGTSRANDGKEDAWLFAGADGAIVRIDVSTRRDGKITRREYYDHDALVRAEEDSDEDGRPDKWETYEAGRLASVAFDTLHRGAPDRRLIYGADGSVALEVDASGDGHFTAAKIPAARTAAR